MSNDNADWQVGAHNDSAGKPGRVALFRNPERQRVRQLLCNERREGFRLTFAVKNWRRTNLPVPAALLVLQRVSRTRERQLSELLRQTAPMVDQQGREIWQGEHFRRFRHVSRAKRFTKIPGKVGWALR